MDILVLLQLMGLDVRGNIADQCDRVAASSAGLLRNNRLRIQRRSETGWLARTTNEGCGGRQCTRAPFLIVYASGSGKGSSFVQFYGP